MDCVAGSRLGDRASFGFSTRLPIAWTNLVQPTRHPPEVIVPVGVVSRCVDTATAHDVREHRARVEVRECYDDVVGLELPASAPATDPAGGLENLVMDGHDLNIQV